jgi:GPI biosynthesis protein family Pig-F
MDPIEIVKVPYKLMSLFSYIATTCTGIGLVCTYQMKLADIKARLFATILLSLFFFGVFIVAGATPCCDIMHTALAALYTAVLSTSSLPFVCDTLSHKRMSPEISSKRSSLNQLISLLFCFPNDDRQDLIARHVSAGCLLTTLQMQILLLYDRGWQIQRWPLPVVMGSTLGWALGHVTAYNYTNKEDTRHRYSKMAIR